MPIVVARDPLNCVAIGSGQCLEEFEALKRVLITSSLTLTGRVCGRRRRWPRRAAGGPRRTLTILLVLVLVSVTVISLDESGRTHGAHLGGQVGGHTTSSRRCARASTTCSRRWATSSPGPSTTARSQQENQKLQAEIGRAAPAGGRGSPFQSRQLRQLQRLLARRPSCLTVASLSTVTAQTIAKSPSDFTATITIDKGRDRGGGGRQTPWSAAGGLVGQVVQASHDTATVRLITAGQSEVGVTFGSPPPVRGGRRPGAGEAADRRTSSSPDTPVHVGEEMYTNGLAGAAASPRGSRWPR